MPPTPRIRNGYLSFAGRYRKMSEALKQGRKRRRTTRQRGVFLGPIVASALVSPVSPVATNLLNGIVGKNF